MIGPEIQAGSHSKWYELQIVTLPESPVLLHSVNPNLNFPSLAKKGEKKIIKQSNLGKM